MRSKDIRSTDIVYILSPNEAITDPPADILYVQHLLSSSVHQLHFVTSIHLKYGATFYRSDATSYGNQIELSAISTDQIA